MSAELFLSIVTYTITIFSIGYRVGSYISTKKITASVQHCEEK